MALTPFVGISRSSWIRTCRLAHELSWQMEITTVPANEIYNSIKGFSVRRANRLSFRMMIAERRVFGWKVNIELQNWFLNYSSAPHQCLMFPFRLLRFWRCDRFCVELTSSLLAELRTYSKHRRWLHTGLMLCLNGAAHGLALIGHSLFDVECSRAWNMQF